MEEGFPTAPIMERLRVKRCFICLREEHYTDPRRDDRQWVHACRCNKIAHQACLRKLYAREKLQTLLQFEPIQPRCQTCLSEYVPIHPKKLMLERLIDAFATAHRYAGRAVGAGLVGLGSLVVAGGFGSTLFLYGVYNIRMRFGGEMFYLHFGTMSDNISDWTQRPATMLSFALGCISYRFLGPTLSYVLDLWPKLPPRSVRARLIRNSPFLPSPPSNSLSSKAWWNNSWPPTPAQALILGSPLITLNYRVLFSMFSHWVMGVERKPHSLNPPWRRFEDNDDEEEDNRSLMSMLSWLYRRVLAAWAMPACAMVVGSGLRTIPMLRGFLGVRPALDTMGLPRKPMFLSVDDTEYWTFYMQWAWQVAEPSWFINSVGMGVCVVTRDLLTLWIEWAKKKNEETVQIVNRDFSGVDISSLDLIQRDGSA